MAATRQKEPKTPFPRQTQSKPGLDSEMDPKPRFQAPLYRGAGKLSGKAALVTGGDSGIGKAVATLYAREGADVAIVYLPEEQSDADETKKSVESEGRRCLQIPGDVKDPAFCQSAIDKTAKALGKIDVLVNNAAFQERQDRPEDISDEQFDVTFRTNVYGYFYMTKAALKHMKPGSAIVNCGSITGLEGNRTLIDYAATKGAIHALTKSLAQNLIERGIRVNCVSPGPVWTPLIPSSGSPEGTAKHGDDKPLGRPAQPEEIAPAFVFFASEADSSYVTGEILTLLGGEVRAG
ncbi:MAG TPA: SDR family oxidoreductase [Planctomycetia bacterium]|jgi:NAD(P)-dependent dehydrogenase (short-subunit alcohol dehydrogenase family)|nr:SDR family oxidoreductase [Planctomycetia bacterium]